MPYSNKPEANTEHKVFQRGFGGAGGIAAQRNQRIQRQRQQLQTDIGRQKMAGADHHAHADGSEHRQRVILAFKDAARLVIGFGVNKQ